MSRLCLGTAQFGMAYGISNTSGRVPPEEVGRILDRAREAGIDTLDTAIAYGESEAVLGQVGADRFRVITKLPPVPSSDRALEVWIREHVVGSLARLRLDRLHGLLLHHPSDAMGPRGTEVLAALGSVRDSGLVERVGLSLYDVGPALDPIASLLDLVQLPYSAFDRRAESSGALQSLHDAGAEIYARSAFLQGVALMKPEELPAQLSGMVRPVIELRAWAQERGVPPVTAAIGHVLADPRIDRVVVGVVNVGQLEEIIAAEDVTPQTAPSPLEVHDPALIDPSRWP